MIIIVYIYFFFACLFSSSNAMQKNEKKLSLQEYSLSKNIENTKMFFNLPNEIQNHIATMNSEILLLEKKCFQHNSCVYSACFNKKETIILTVSDDKIIRLWSVRKRKILKRFKHNVFLRSACFNRNETQILTSTWGIFVHINNIETKQILEFHHNNHQIKSACFNKNKKLILTASDDKTARIWQRYTNWTLDQLLLYTLLFTWLQVQKPDKSVNSIEAFIKTTCIYDEIDSENVKQIIDSFTPAVQAAIWNKMNLFIQKYGK